ncbi:MAG: hypothetical protein JSW28_00640, partial [Thermoplasmata archaeon]
NQSIHYEYQINETELSYNFIRMDDIDILKSTDTEVYAYLTEDCPPIVEIVPKNDDTVPHPLNPNFGLEEYEISTGKYIEIELGIKDQNDPTVPLDAATLKIYYREEELDMTGDGDADDFGDLNESTLGLYYYDEDIGQWEKISADMEWVLDFGVNTTDVDMYGESYAGCLWARVTHLSLFGMAAQPYNRPPDVSSASPSVEYLWSPNHKFTDISIEGVTDPDGDAITITVISITSDEPTATAKGAGGANHAPDAYGVGTDTASIRAERSGKGNGRVYVITFAAEDGRGGETIGTVAVFVPLSRWKDKYDVIDDGQYYDATVVC